MTPANRKLTGFFYLAIYQDHFDHNVKMII
uniref:Uncharacterized protein n=1 Tax=Podoviridae sp. ct9P15 TaxID=2826543 RepID=A0A8S5MGC9_9CAUD|nr:MAG TPA: hypothetical protein [Podoviridae sp. ct9P15]